MVLEMNMFGDGDELFENECSLYLASDRYCINRKMRVKL